MVQPKKESKEAREFRGDILKNALANLPATIFINEMTGVYHIRDNTLMIAWADDLPRGGGKKIIESLADFIVKDERDLFLDIFLRRGTTSGSLSERIYPQPFRLGTGNERSYSATLFGVNVGRRSGGQIYEIRIEQ